MTAAQGDYEAAISDYGQALKIDPRHFKAVYNRGFSFDKVRVNADMRICVLSSDLWV